MVTVCDQLNTKDTLAVILYTCKRRSIVRHTDLAYYTVQVTIMQNLEQSDVVTIGESGVEQDLIGGVYLSNLSIQSHPKQPIPKLDKIVVAIH